MTSRPAMFVAPRTIAPDVNPIIVGPQGRSAFALDVRAVIRE